MGTKKLEELLPTDATGLDGDALFKYLVKDEGKYTEAGRAMSSGCDACIAGGQPTKPRTATYTKEVPKYAKE